MNAVPSYTREEESGPLSAQASWGAMHRYRFALWSLVLKDFRVRYRNMSLGILWSVINPLVMLGVLVVVFSFIHPSHHTQNFPVFLLIGLVLYNFLSLCLPPTCTAIIDNASLVKKVIFPRELIPLATVFSQLVHVGIQFVILLCFAVAFAVPFSWGWLWMPFIYGVMLVFVLGSGFICCALDVVYRDVLYVVESGLKVLFWLTPIFYDMAQVKLNLPRPLYLLYILNPMAGCVDAMRSSMLRGEHPDPESFGIAIVVSVLLLGIGWRLYSRRQKLFADQL